MQFHRSHCIAETIWKLAKRRRRKIAVIIFSAAFIGAQFSLVGQILGGHGVTAFPSWAESWASPSWALVLGQWVSCAFGLCASGMVRYIFPCSQDGIRPACMHFSMRDETAVRGVTNNLQNLVAENATLNAFPSCH